MHQKIIFLDFFVLFLVILHLTIRKAYLQQERHSQRQVMFSWNRKGRQRLPATASNSSNFNTKCYAINTHKSLYRFVQLFTLYNISLLFLYIYYFIFVVISSHESCNQFRKVHLFRFRLGTYYFIQP